jgi:rhodanese-related sulfurtransferase
MSFLRTGTRIETSNKKHSEPTTIMKTLLSLILAVSASPAWAALETNHIEQITGLKGSWSASEGVFKVSQPRDDVAVKVDEWKMPPFMGLTSWAAFLVGKKAEAMVMGDLVLFEDEVNPVMSAAFDNGLEVTALHNHFFHADPPVYFMHIGGEGTVEKLAGGVKAALDKVKEIRAANATPAKSFGGGLPTSNNITPGPLAAAFIAKPQQKAGMVKFVFGRVARMECGCQVGAEMGLNTWASFGGRDDNAVVDGDFACQDNELQPVLKSLRGANINIVAIHHHMIHETPRYVFLHYWGRGKAMDLAQAIRSARGEQTKAAAGKARAEGGFKAINAADFEKRRAKGKAPVLDVRSPEEFGKGHVTGAINADIHSPEFATKAAQFDKKKPILVNCHLGSRGDIAAAELARMGFKNVFNLEGGLDAWEKAGNQAEK